MSNWTNANGGNWNDAGNWSDGVPDSTKDAVIPAGVLGASKTITVNAIANCLNLDFSGLDQALTFANSAYALNVYGNLVLPASNLTVSFSGTGYLYFKSTSTGNTLTMGATAGRTFNVVYFDGIGGEWTLQDNVTTSGIRLVNGSLITNNKAITAGFMRTATGTSKSLTLGSSTISVDYFWIEHAITIDAGTSTITLSTGANNDFRGGGNTYYNVVINSAIGATITGANTFNNLTRTGSASITASLSLSANQTITGTLTLTGNNATNYRLLVYSSTIGTARTLTCNGSTNITNADFRDIAFAGSAIPDFSSAEIGDCGGNSGATFRAGETRYYHVGTGNYHDAKWYSETNGGGVAKGMPLPQDTAKWDANSFDGSGTLTIANARVGSIDFSEVDDAVTLTLSNAIECYGSYVLGNNITPSGNFIIGFYGRGSFNINGYNKTVYATYFYFGSYTYLGSLNASGNGFYVPSNSATPVVVDFNDFDFSFIYFLLSSSNASTIKLGDGIITITGSGANFEVYSNHTIQCDHSTIKTNNTAATYSRFRGGGKTFYNLWLANGSGTAHFEIIDSNTFNNIKIDSGRTLKFTAGTTTTLSSVTISGATITGATAASYTIARANGVIQALSFENCTISYMTVSVEGSAYAINCIDGGNNTKLRFWRPPIAIT